MPSGTMKNFLCMKLLLFLFIIISGYNSSILALQHDREVFSVRGMVQDLETGEPLPSATITIEGSYSGTITNRDGYYTIELTELPAVIQVRYLGYYSETRSIDSESDPEQHFYLEPALLEMDEIVVTDRDPALSVMERVIARKQIWRSTLDTYKSEAYTRQVLENDTSIVSISESISRAYWDTERGHREVVRSERKSSNLDDSINFTGVSYLPNFYDDNIEIAGFTLAGPTHPDALRYYHFTMKDYMRMDDDLVYVISVEPRRQLQPLFRGTVYVLSSDYALLEVKLEPNEVVRFPPPVREFDLGYEQQFSNFGGEYWLPVDMRIRGNIHIEMIGLRFPTITFSQVSRMSDYQVNTSLPDTLFDRNQQLVVDTATIGDRTLLEESRDRVPLTIEEELAYQTIDSTMTLERAFQPTGFLARAFLDDEDSGSRPGRVGNFVNRIIPDGLSPVFHYNRVDGFHLGLAYRKSIGPASFSAKSGYNTHAETWDYGGGLEFNWLNRHAIRSDMLFEYKNSTATRYDSKYHTWMNTIGTLSGFQDYFDYYRNEKIRAGIRVDFPGQNITTDLVYSDETHTSQTDDVMNYSLFGWNRMRRPNPAITEGNLRAVALNIGINRQPDNFGISGGRSALFHFEYSGYEMNSDYDYLRLETQLNWNFQTFYQRRLLPNTLDLQFSAGISDGSMPIQRNFSMDGSLSGFTPFGVMKTRRGIPYEGSRYWQVYGEHNFRTIPFELLGLNSLADRGWSVILFAGAGESKVNSIPVHFESSQFVPQTSNGIHSEAGISLNSIFGIMRIDFANRLDEAGFYIGVSVPRYF
jgi:hypothetical protein